MSNHNSLIETNKSSYQVICGVLIPFLMKQMVILPISYYRWAAAIGLILSIILFVLRRKKGIKQYLYFSISFSIAVVLCLVLFPRITTNKEADWVEFRIDNSYRDHIEAQANKGDLKSLEMIGSYYAFPWAKKYFKDSDHIIVDHDFFDVRDFNKATKYFEMAAEMNSAFAYCMLGEIRMEGLGCRPSRERAINEFKKSFELDNSYSTIFDCISAYSITEEEFPEGYQKFLEQK